MQRRPEVRGARARRRGKTLEMTLNVIIVALLLVIGYFSYAFVSRNFITKPVAADTAVVAAKDLIQLDVLNGCGAKGVGVKVTNYLRSVGFDVVEAKNYKTFSIPRTLVVDRVGNLAKARRVAAALGIGPDGVIQQINPDYFVDVSVIIGGDYSTLAALR